MSGTSVHVWFYAIVITNIVLLVWWPIYNRQKIYTSKLFRDELPQFRGNSQWHDVLR